MPERPKPRPKHKKSVKAPQPSLNLKLPPLRRVVVTPLEEALSQPEPGPKIDSDSVITLNTVIPELADDVPVVSTPPPASVTMDHVPQEPKDNIEFPYPHSPPAASNTTVAPTQKWRPKGLTDSESSEEQPSPTPIRKKAKPITKNSKASAHKDDEKILRGSHACHIKFCHSKSLFSGIVLLIPQASEGSDKRKTLRSTDLFEDALETIHKTIGCADVKRKPSLAYKLSDVSQRASSINLENEDDWLGLCEEVVDRQRKKKTTIAVSINVPLDVSTKCQWPVHKVLLTVHFLVYGVITCPSSQGWQERWQEAWKEEASPHMSG